MPFPRPGQDRRARMSASVLDLLSVLGRLPLSGDQGFVEAARVSLANAQVDTDIRSLRRNLEGLGHIRRLFGADAGVEVIKPRLCVIPGGNADSCAAILTGARTVRLVEE